MAQESIVVQPNNPVFETFSGKIKVDNVIGKEGMLQLKKQVRSESRLGFSLLSFKKLRVTCKIIFTG